MSRVRFVDQTKFNAYKVTNATTATSASYANFATSASYALNSDSAFTAAGISGSWQGATGSMSVLSASYATTASYAISASHEIIKEISSSHANTADTAAGLTGQPSILVTNITASGNISSSGTIIAEDGDIKDFLNVGRLTVNNSGLGSNDFRVEGTSTQYLIFADANQNSVGIGTSTPVSVFGVQGDITTLGANGHITASGNISASGTGSFGSINGPIDGDFAIRSDKNINLYVDNDDDGSFHKFQLWEDGSVFFAVAEDGKAAIGEAVDSNSLDGLTVVGGITATGNITGSNISASGLLFTSASEGVNGTDNWTLLYNTGSGQVFYTASSAVGGGGTSGPFTQVGSTSTYQATDSKDLQITGSLIVSGSFVPHGKAGINNVIIGDGAGRLANAQTTYNVFVGRNAGGNDNDFGDQNVLVGNEAGYLGNQTGNTSIGYHAGRGWGTTGTTPTTGYNVSIGYQSGYTAAGRSTEIHNTLLGSFSGRNITAGSGNTLLGYSAGYNALGDGNIIIGSGSLGEASMVHQLRIGNGADIVTISGSLATGHVIVNSLDVNGATKIVGDAQITGSLLVSGSSIEFKTSGGTVFSIAETGSFALGEGATNSLDNNVAIGKNAIGAGSHNVAMGNSADSNAGSYNVAIGSGAQTANSFGIAMGGSAYAANSTIAIGHSSIGGTNTISIGYDAGHTSGEDNILIGYKTGNSTSGNKNIIFGSGSLGGAIDNQLRIGNTPVVTISASLVTGDIIFPSTASADYFVGDGSQLTGLPAGGPFTQVGSTSTYQAQSKDLQITGSLKISGSLIPVGPRDANTTNVVIGSLAGNAMTATADNNVFIGYEAGEAFQGGDDNIMIGRKAGEAADNDSRCILIGWKAGGASTLGSNNIYIGYESGRDASSAHSNIGMGYYALWECNDGASFNIGIGNSAGKNLTNGDYNLFIGESAGEDVTTGIGNIVFGSGSKGEAGMSNQLRIGSGMDITTISASLATGHVLLNSLAISSSTSTMPLSIQGSGSTVFNVIGSEGTLFSVDDDLNGMLFTTNDISGLPVLQASASGELYLGKSPQSLYTTAVISATSASSTASVYALSTSSYDGAFFDYTISSASNAHAGSIMSIWNGGNINYTDTATTDIGSTAGIDLQVIISASQAQLIAITDSTDPNTWKVKTIVRSI